MNKSKVIVSLDYSNAKQALDFCRKVNPMDCRIKVGKELFTAEGPKLIEKLRKLDYEIFLDLKYHDIPNTVAKACRVALDLDIWMLNIHASGGRKMMEAAHQTIEKYGSENKPLLIAVTVLTSISSNDLAELGINNSVNKQVVSLAKMAKDIGLDGVVCSGVEVRELRKKLGDNFCFVTPGVRLEDSANDDQKRIITPIDAIRAGSDYLVIGRPITESTDPVNVLNSINSSINALD